MHKTEYEFTTASRAARAVTTQTRMEHLDPRLLSPASAHSVLLSRLSPGSGIDGEASTSAAQAQSSESAKRITLTFLLGDDAPFHHKFEPEQDTYVLLAPLRRCEAVLESGGRVLFDGTLCPGMLSMTCPGEQVNKTFRTPAHAAVISYPGQLLRKTLQRPMLAGSVYSPIQALLQPDYQVQRISASLLSAVEFDPKHRQLFIDGLAYALLACLNRDRQSAPKHRRMNQPDRLSDSELARCVEFADAMISERFELKEWAAVLGLSVPDFARRFQCRTQQSPYAWFMNWRIDRSKNLLQTQSLTLADIALGVGFCSQSHFTEAFRRRVGISPGRWRSRLPSSVAGRL
jgi:AraC family transcriptional regulator